MTEGTIVTATGTASSSRTPGLSKVLEQAMADAVMQALADGITDEAEILARKLKARDVAKAGFYAQQIEAAKAEQ